MINIDYIMDLLDWNNSSEQQMLGVKLARNVKCINAFLQPGIPYGKNVWDNCAIILSERSDEELSPYFMELLEWMQDLNWPGAFTIVERLRKVNISLLSVPLSKTVEKAEKQGEDIWLDYLSVFTENSDLKKYIGDKQYNLLMKHYPNFWGLNSETEQQ